jgi:UDP-glucose 4-epimerase
MNILVAGGAGFIGSHTTVELLEAGHEVVIVDNLSNSSKESIHRVESLTGKQTTFYQLDVCDADALDEVFAKHAIDAVIHFAGLKAVDTSVKEPLLYYQNNLVSTLNLCESMSRHNVKQLIFSSSATVYGDPESVPIEESASIHATNPYGQTKVMIEQMLQDLSRTNQGWRISLLRYFNPIGAHPSGNIGEDPNGVPDNLVPFVAQVAVGRREKLAVFGNDYDTPDGTGVRDYIHVVDLAKGHVAALSHPPEENSAKAYNLGCGRGHSVLEVIKAFEGASGKDIPYAIASRRPGDIGTCYANPSKAEKLLHWRAELSLEDACLDAWRWQSQNPNGFKA